VSNPSQEQNRDQGKSVSQGQSPSAKDKGKGKFIEERISESKSTTTNTLGRKGNSCILITLISQR
jgi:hypothetical protein